MSQFLWDFEHHPGVVIGDDLNRKPCLTTGGPSHTRCTFAVVPGRDRSEMQCCSFSLGTWGGIEDPRVSQSQRVGSQLSSY